MEKKIKRREQNVAAFERDNYYACESKEKQERFFFSRETYTRIIVIDLINSEIIRIFSRGFSLKRERVFHVNFVFLCVIVVLDC